jgi:c(7)-type cytochrome triheme protein
MMLGRIFLSILIVLAVAGCRVKEEAVTQIEGKTPLLSQDELIKSLPCFKCHSEERFLKTPEAGRFPHRPHISIDIHCNQCHEIRGHHEIAIDTQICAGCHSLKIITYSAYGLTVNFSHERHAKLFSCKDCHPEVFLMKKGSQKMMMEDIYKGKFCGKCHNGKAAFPSTNCNSCHNMAAIEKDFSYKVPDLPPAIFSHQLHTAIFNCNDCHISLFKYRKGSTKMRMDDLYNGRYCGTCHNGEKAFSSMECQRCHPS